MRWRRPTGLDPSRPETVYDAMIFLFIVVGAVYYAWHDRKPEYFIIYFVVGMASYWSIVAIVTIFQPIAKVMR